MCGVQTELSHSSLMSDASTVLVDVRNPSEFACEANRAVPGAVNMPLPQLDQLLLTADKSKNYLLYCIGACPRCGWGGWRQLSQTRACLPRPVVALTSPHRFACPCVLLRAGGFRSSISASYFQRAGFKAVDVRGGLLPVILPILKATGVVTM